MKAVKRVFGIFLSSRANDQFAGCCCLVHSSPAVRADGQSVGLAAQSPAHLAERPGGQAAKPLGWLASRIAAWPGGRTNRLLERSARRPGRPIAQAAPNRSADRQLGRPVGKAARRNRPIWADMWPGGRPANR